MRYCLVGQARPRSYPSASGSRGFETRPDLAAQGSLQDDGTDPRGAWSQILIPGTTLIMRYIADPIDFIDADRVEVSP